MRIHVRPAAPGAGIPDPAHRSDLPQEGRMVEWSPYWARLARRGDVINEAGGEIETPAEPGRD